jgi:hypothetical protein
MMHPPRSNLDLPLPPRIYPHTVRMLLKNTYWMILDRYGRLKITKIVEMTVARRGIRVLISFTKLRMRWER